MNEPTLLCGVRDCNQPATHTVTSRTNQYQTVCEPHCNQAIADGRIITTYHNRDIRTMVRQIRNAH